MGSAIELQPKVQRVLVKKVGVIGIRDCPRMPFTKFFIGCEMCVCNTKSIFHAVSPRSILRKMLSNIGTAIEFPACL